MRKEWVKTRYEKAHKKKSGREVKRLQFVNYTHELDNAAVADEI